MLEKNSDVTQTQDLRVQSYLRYLLIKREGPWKFLSCKNKQAQLLTEKKWPRNFVDLIPIQVIIISSCHKIRKHQKQLRS